VAVGIALGLLLVSRIQLRADRARGLVWLPGGATTLVLILLVFAARYTFGVLQGMSPVSSAIRDSWWPMSGSRASSPVFFWAGLSVFGASIA
jgi:hypothetical protein